MRCQHCGCENPEEARFCIECGALLHNRCANCGLENLPRAKFCASCGTSLEGQSRVQSLGSRVQAPRPPASYTPSHLAERILAEQAAMEARSVTDGERKTITALFADIKEVIDHGKK